MQIAEIWTDQYTEDQSNLCPSNFSVKKPQRGISHFLFPRFRLSTINRGRRPDDGGCVCRELPSLSFVVVTTHLLSHWLLPSNMKAFLKKLEGKKKEKTPLILDDTGHPWISFLWSWQDWGLYPAFLFWLGGVMRGCDPWSCDSWEEWGTGGRLPQAFSTVDMARREANLTFSQDLF